MGYMGLNSWIDSDNAAAFVNNALFSMAKLVQKELKNKDNAYNTPGFVNVALWAESFLPDDFVYRDQDLGVQLLRAIEMLEKELVDLKKEKDWGSKDMHVTAYKRMIKSLKNKMAD
jgi:hypothetical protein